MAGSPGETFITGPDEVRAFLRRVPLQVDADRFLRFALGFPRHYLEKTPPVEVVRHYGLMEGLGGRAVISSLAEENGLWRLCLVARDRSFLFARIAGSLSAFGMNIVAAEAFANESALVLDTFRFSDPKARFRDDAERRAFQALLEEAIEGRAELPEPAEPQGVAGSLRPAFDDRSHPEWTRLVVEGPDRFGLLYRLSRALSEAGCSIELARIATPDSGVHDEFYLSEGGARLTAKTRTALAAALAGL
ncbi:MAG TPA: ACT domain-containing protein [Vicinamibacteria bacterium]